MHWNTYLFSKHEERRRKNLFPVRTVDGRLVDQRSFAFCCQHLPFLSVDTYIGVHTKTKQSYNLKRNNSLLRFWAKVSFLPFTGVIWLTSRKACHRRHASMLWRSQRQPRKRIIFEIILVNSPISIYLKIQPKTIDLSTGLREINPINSVVITQRAICFDISKLVYSAVTEYQTKIF